jgi:hypothetical protein
MRRTPSPAALALVASLLAPVSASMAADELERCDPDSAARVRFIEDRLEQRRRYADWYWKGWTGFYALGTAVQSYRGAVENDDSKQADLVISAVKALFGTTVFLLRPPRARLGADASRAIAATSPERCRERLRVAEAALREDAKNADRRRSWKQHALNVLLNVGGAIIVDEAYDDPSRGWRSAGIGIAVGEVAILTFPWKADEDLEEYQAKFGPRTTATHPTIGLGAWGRGARVTVRF